MKSLVVSVDGMGSDEVRGIYQLLMTTVKVRTDRLVGKIKGKLEFYELLTDHRKLIIPVQYYLP